VPSKPRAKKTPVIRPEPTQVVRSVPVVGHEDVLARFRQAGRQGRLGHAYLFVGPAGIGKRRVAKHLAQALLCERSPLAEMSPCGVCASCVQVLAGSHPDVLEFAKPADKNELPIAVVQDLVGQLALKPARGQYKVAILDDADDLNEESSNCFLKTLEEPPSGTVLILIATSQETQLATIQSRCQVVRFRPMTDEQVAELILQLQVASSREEADRLSVGSEGSISAALDWSQPPWKEFASRFAEGLTGPPLAQPAFVDFVLAFIEDAGKESSAKRTRAKQVIQLAARHLLQSLRDKCQAQPSDESADLLADMIERTLDAEYHVSRMAGLPLAVETWLDDLHRLRQETYVPPVR
jgi:DNA polymerase III subunit delta'